MTTALGLDSTRRALREALAAVDRGDNGGAATIARAHAAHGRTSRGRVVLVLPLRRTQLAPTRTLTLPDIGPDDLEAS